MNVRDTGSPMFTSIHSVHVPARPEAVWPLVSDPHRHHEWRDELVSMTLQEGSPAEVGAVYREVIAVGPRQVSSRFRITEREAPRRLVFETFEPSWIPSTNTLSLVPDGDGTTVTFESDNRTSGWHKLLDPVLKPLFDRSLERELGNLRKRVSPPR